MKAATGATSSLRTGRAVRGRRHTAVGQSIMRGPTATIHQGCSGRGALVEGGGRITEPDTAGARAAGFTAGAIAEIVAEVAINILAEIAIDFPLARPPNSCRRRHGLSPGGASATERRMFSPARHEGGDRPYPSSPGGRHEPPPQAPTRLC